MSVSCIYLQGKICQVRQMQVEKALADIKSGIPRTLSHNGTCSKVIFPDLDAAGILLDCPYMPLEHGTQINLIF